MNFNPVEHGAGSLPETALEMVYKGREAGNQRMTRRDYGINPPDRSQVIEKGGAT
jgi:hypothetical protein